MSDVALQLDDVGKIYKLYGRPIDRALDALGVGWAVGWRRKRYRPFWALRGVSAEIHRGERVGIVGPNGSGKTTLLKIIAGNTAATEGALSVSGTIQALMDLGTGFHPEFTGRENIRASLGYQGYDRRQIRAKEGEIIDFTELESFIDQPVRTYSAGMYARLAFATATAIEPDILIIDEVLGAGDAYFNGKCLERMKKLTDAEGATVLFVSHDRASVERLCDRCIWIDRGKVAMDGPAGAVTKAYGRHIRAREELRQMARKRSAVRMTTEGWSPYDETVLLRFQGAGSPGFALNRVTLSVAEKRIGDLEPGEPQDSDPSHLSWVILDGASTWDDPMRLSRDAWARGLETRPDGLCEGQLAMCVPGDEPGEHRVALSYVPPDSGEVVVSAYDHRGREFIPVATLPAGDGSGLARAECVVPQAALPSGRDDRGRRIVRWPGSNELMIDRVGITGADGRARATFKVGGPLSLRVTIKATATGEYPLRPAAVLHRIDGVRVCCHIGEPMTLSMAAGQTQTVTLDFGPINLGNGDYLFAVALYRHLDPDHPGSAEVYDLVEREYEFRVIGRSVIDQAVFSHPAEWRLTP